MPLTNVRVKNAKARDKDYKLSDEKGMYLLVKKSGAKYWRLKYRFGGKENVLALGVYSDVSLAKARKLRSAARELLSDGKDPSIERRQTELRKKSKVANTFESVGIDWHKVKSQKWSERHSDDVLNGLKKDIFPLIGNLPISEIDTLTVRSVLDRVQNRGALEIGSRLRQRCSAIFKHGMVLGLCHSDPADALKSVMLTPATKNLPALSPKEFPNFWRKAVNYEGEEITTLAVKLLALTFVRTGELIGARWSEFDFEVKMWNIPEERMKKRRPHFVPLASQTLEVLTRIHAITGKGELVFPWRGQPQQKVKTMSNGTVLRLIDRVGYRNRMSGHGFRSVASTILNESGKFNYDAIEKQLAHQEEDLTQAAYHRARYKDDRIEMMQWWADYLDSLNADAGNGNNQLLRRR